MKFMVVVFLFLLVLWTQSHAVEFFSTASVETFRTDLNTTMVSPNLYFKLWRVEGYGFIDRYFEDPKFYHGEFMLAFQPLTMKPFDRVSIIAERRWDKFADDENSYGIRIRLW